MSSNQPPQCEDLPVVVSDPDIEKQVSPLTLPNGVVSEPPTASRRVLTLCWAYLIILLCLVALGAIALYIYITYGLLLVIVFGTALGLSLACDYAMGLCAGGERKCQECASWQPSWSLGIYVASELGLGRQVGDD